MRKLGDLNPKRNSFGLYAPSGRGKTLQSLSFAGEGIGKAIVINVETGPEEGAGGLTTLFHCDGIYPHLNAAWLRENTLVYDVRSWEEMQSVLAQIKLRAADLVADGYTLLVLDGGSALSYLIRLAFTRLAPEGGASAKRHTIIGALVTDAEGNATSNMELAYYDVIYDRYLDMHSKLKQLPFTFVATYLEDEAYDPETRKIKIGRGPRLVGKKLPSQIAAEVDGFFHLEVKDGQRMWLTDNDPTELGNPVDAIAKNRFGKRVEKWIEADGSKLLERLGVM